LVSSPTPRKNGQKTTLNQQTISAYKKLKQISSQYFFGIGNPGRYINIKNTPPKSNSFDLNPFQENEKTSMFMATW